jgi:hypothetical protein
MTTHEQAIEAAVEAWYGYNPVMTKEVREDMNRAIRAYLAIAPQANEAKDALIRDLVAALNDIAGIVTASFPALGGTPPIRSAIQALTKAKQQGYEP